MSAGWGCYAGGCKLGARLTDTAYLETLPDWQNAAFFGAPRPAPPPGRPGGGHPGGMEGSEAVATCAGALAWGGKGGLDSSQEVPSGLGLGVSEPVELGRSQVASRSAPPPPPSQGRPRGPAGCPGQRGGGR